MTTNTNDKLLQQAQKCFFEAMMQGWAAEVKAVPVPDMPGHKQTIYENGKFRVIDRFCVSSAGMSAGTTTIWYQNDPIWFMSYGGFYREKDVSFLKRALLESYVLGRFTAGRGPVLVRDEAQGSDLVYTNWIHYGNDDFKSFGGREEICSLHAQKEILGFHNYSGMALI